MTCSGVVVRDEGNVTSTGLRIASASAAVVVSAAVAGAALFGGSVISDPGAPATRISDSWLCRPLRPYRGDTESTQPRAAGSAFSA